MCAIGFYFLLFVDNLLTSDLKIWQWSTMKIQLGNLPVFCTNCIAPRQPHETKISLYTLSAFILKLISRTSQHKLLCYSWKVEHIFILTLTFYHRPGKPKHTVSSWPHHTSAKTWSCSLSFPRSKRSILYSIRELDSWWAWCCRSKPNRWAAQL